MGRLEANEVKRKQKKKKIQNSYSTELWAYYVNQKKKKPYETSHSGLSLKISHNSILGKIRKELPTKDLLTLAFCKKTVLNLWYFGKY